MLSKRFKAMMPLIVLVYNLLFLCNGAARNNNNIFPNLSKELLDTCNLQQFQPNIFNKLYDVDWSEIGFLLHLHCRMDSTNEKLHFNTLRSWLTTLSINYNVFTTIHCYNGGMVSLPWPMKSPRLVGLFVDGCIISDQYGDFLNTDILNAPDYLKVLDIRNSVWISDSLIFESFTQTGSLSKVSSSYDCGQDESIEIMIFRNNTYRQEEIIHDENATSLTSFNRNLNDTINLFSFFNDAEKTPESSNYIDHLIPNIRRDIDLDPFNIGNKDVTKSFSSDFNNESAAIDIHADFLDSIFAMNNECNFKQLRSLQNVLTQLMPKDYFRFLVKGSTFPQLTALNYSNAGFRHFPQQLQHFWDFFPVLKTIDLSYNEIDNVRFKSTLPGIKMHKTMLDISFNKISIFSSRDLLDWSAIDNLFVDIRNNPFNCSSQFLSGLRPAFESTYFFSGKLLNYEYIKHLTCYSPPIFQGFTLLDAFHISQRNNHFKHRGNINHNSKLCIEKPSYLASNNPENAGTFSQLELGLTFLILTIQIFLVY